MSLQLKAIIGLVSILLFTSCQESDTHFAKRLVGKFRAESINRKHINWDEFQSKVLESAKISKDSAIITALTLNNNRHSWYLKEGKLLRGNYPVQAVKRNPCYLTDEFYPKDFKDVAYIKIEEFYNEPNDPVESKRNAREYINQILSSIKQQDKPGLKAWVIDLRNNGGGDMWPMLISVSPFLSNGVLGYFKLEDKSQVWSLKDNVVFLDRKSQNDRVYGSAVDYKIKNKSVKVAILMNHKTGSSGEGLAITLKSLKNVKYFGTHTYGFSTSNRPIRMNPKEFLILTTHFMADFREQIYKNGIFPDYETCSSEQLEKALYDWIYQ